MAEAEPPDKEFWVFLPLRMEFTENDKGMQLSKEKTHILYDYLCRERRLLNNRIPHINEIILLDSGKIEMVFKIANNEKTLNMFYAYSKRHENLIESNLEQAIQHFISDMSVELQLGLPLNTSILVHAYLDDTILQKMEKELRDKDITKSRVTQKEKLEMEQSLQKDKRFSILLPLTVKKNKDELTKRAYSDLHCCIRKEMATLQACVSSITELEYVEVIDVYLSSTRELNMEFSIPKNINHLSQFYDCTQKSDGDHDNILENVMRSYFEMILEADLRKKLQPSIFMQKEEFSQKQIELVDIEDSNDEHTQLPVQQKSISNVKDKVNIFEQEATGTVTKPGSYPGETQNRTTSLAQEVPCIRKTLVVFVPTEPNEKISSVKIKSSFKILHGKKLIPCGSESNFYYIEVTVPIHSDVKYIYSAKTQKYHLYGMIPTYSERKSATLFLTDQLLQRDLFFGLTSFDPNSISEHFLDICYSHGDDLESMRNCIREIEGLLKNLKWGYKEREQLINMLIKGILQNKTKKALTLLMVGIGNFLFNTTLLKKIEPLDSEKAAEILEALGAYRLRELNLAYDITIVNLCFTLCEIRFGKKFCLLLFMDACYPFLDERYINEMLDKQFQAMSTIDLVSKGCDVEPAIRLCKEVHRPFHRDNTNSQSKILLNRLLLHLPTKMTICVAEDLNKNACSSGDLPTYLLEVVSNSVKQGIMSAAKSKDIQTFHDLWKGVRDSSFCSPELKIAFEKAVIDFVSSKSSYTDALRSVLLNMANDELLFVYEANQCDILENIAESMIPSMHKTFLDLVHREKFGPVCSVGRKDIFLTWMKRAIEHHKSGGSVKEVSKMYSALGDLLSIKQIENEAELKESLLEYVFRRLQKVKLDSALKEMHKIETVVKECPVIEEVFNQHISALMRKTHAGNKAYELLQTVCTHGTLRVNSRVTARIVILILDGSFSENSPPEDVGLFKEMVKESKFWKLIFEGEGKCIKLIQETESYRKALSCLESVRERFIQSDIPYTFILEYQDTMKWNAVDLLRLNNRRPIDYRQLWVDISAAFSKEIEKVDIVRRVFSCILDNFHESSLPKALRDALPKALPKGFKKLYHDLVSYDKDLKTQLTAHNLQKGWLPQTLTQRLSSTCSKLDGVVNSRVFWNVGTEKTVEAFHQYLSSPEAETETTEEEIIQAIATLFVDSQTSQEQDSYDDVLSHEDVEQAIHFFEIVLDIGVGLYKTEWNRIRDDTEFLLKDFSVMFERAEYQCEIEIAEKYLHISTSPSLKMTLHRLHNLHDMKKTVETFRKALTSLNINQSDDEEFYDAVKSFEDLLSGDSASYTLSEVGEALDTVYKIAEPLTEDTVSLLQAVGESSKLIEFLQSIIDEDIRNLIDAVEDISEQHVQETTVSSLIEIKRFLHPLLKTGFERKAQAVFTIIHKQTTAHGKSASSIPAKIDDCMNNLHNLKSLYNNVANRSEQTKETIQNIVKQGKFEFLLDKDKSECSFKASYTFKKNKSSHQGPVLFDLRSRALLLMNKRESTDGLKGNELETFIECIDRCAEISDLVMKLHATGHIQYKKYKAAKDAPLLKGLKDILQSDYNQWINHLEDVRKWFYVMNFLQGSQIHILHDYLATPQSGIGHESSQEEVETLLKFIHPSLCASQLREVYQQEETMEGCFDEYSFTECIGRMLHCCCKGLPLFVRPFEDETGRTKRITDVVQPGKLFLAHLDDASPLVVRTILTLYYNTVNRLPEPNQVLFCSGQTTWSEIDLLIRRCLGSSEYFSKNVLFCIANVEALPNELQFRLVGALRNLDRNTRYLFAVVCRGSKNHPFVDELNEYVCRIRPLSDKVMEHIFHTECPDVTSITSKVAGLGKTTHINQTAFLSAKLLKTLHVSGTFGKDEIVSRLKALQIDKSNMLHMDIGTLGNPLEFDIFLFELIVLRFVTTGRNSVYLSTSHVAIEIANSLQDSLRKSLQTAVSFKRLHLDWHNYDNYIVSKELHSPIQVVCHFLHELDGGLLDTKDIQFNGVNCVKALSSQTCRKLLRRHFPSAPNMSFCVVNIFLNVLSDQLKKMSNSSFFRISRIKDMVGNKCKPSVRSSLVKALIEVSKEFSSRSVDAYRATQLSTIEGSLNSEVLPQEKGFAAHAAERTAGMIQWEDSNHLMYVFHNQNIQTISPVYRDKTKVPDHIKSLFESQMKKELQDYRKMSQPELQVILQKVARSNPLMLKDGILHELAKDYALTPDNLLKMILIMLRIKANIPVIIMGETGCGKTSLIRYLASICEVEFDVLNIHAGVEEHSIIDKITSSNLKAMNNLGKEHWLFFDEINTSEYVGLISDMICHKVLFGQRLAPNLVLLGACNPYKLRSASAVSTAGLKGKVLTDELSRLVYRVLPLPEMLVDYVWDFGSLDVQDEKLYISRMTESVFHDQRKYHEVFTDLLSRSQMFVRGKDETTCSVSLRDVKRCKTLAEWFMDILEKKRTNRPSSRTFIRMNKQETAMVLSLAHCYHSRIPDIESRREYRQAISEVFKSHGNYFSEKDIDAVIKNEQDDILNRMELPPGTAKNTALRENVFVLLVCILNKIPIFVVGKPGCSKSLSMQVIRSNLRGGDSKNEFFKELRQLYCVSFQGSESSTSDGIIKVFEKAEKYQESNQVDDVMSVVILDEIGLAEISRFNPLKVLHNLLEPDGRDRPNVAVVGISNWSLDASKMNRAIHLSRPDMDENELFETGMSIFDSFVETESPDVGNSLLDTLSHSKLKPQLKTEDFKDDLENIAHSYFKYSKSQTFQNFHGLRDFYSLVKYFAKEMSNNPKVTVEEKDLLILKGLERNFGGLPSERSALLSTFNLKHTSKPCSVIELIRNNVEDEMARHLMLITTGESVLGILDQMLDSSGRENRELIFGSQFEEDLTDDYNYRILNRIIICMEQGVVLILKDLESIYGSLYDMLNQNYTIIGKKKNCRVALGPYSNPICHVATSFRCIVIVDDSKLKYSDPPFLNRFEKQHLRFSDIISPGQADLIEKMNLWVRDVCVLDHFDETDAFPICGDDMISSLILKFCREDETLDTHGEAFILEKCKNALLWIIKPEVVIRIRKNDIQYESEQLIDTYFKLPVHGGMEGLLDYQLGEDTSHLSETNLMTVIFTNSNIHTKVLQDVSRWSLQVEKLGSFKSEKQLSLRMNTFWHESNTAILILHCSAIDDEKHIMLAKSTIERKRQEYLSANWKLQRKHAYLVIHMDRSKRRSNILSQINFLSSWELVTLDSLERPTTLLPTVCTMSLHDALIDRRPFNDYIREQLFWSFTRIKYSEAGRSVDSITGIMLEIQSSQVMLDTLDKLVYCWLKRYSTDIDDMEWQTRVAFDNQALQTSSSFIEALEAYISQMICVPLSKFIYKMDSECILDTFFVDDDFSKERKDILTEVLFDNRRFSILDIPEETGPESYVCRALDLKLKMPFSKIIFDSIESTHDEFMYSVKMLKGGCGIEQEDDLPDEILVELEKRQDLVVCHQIPLILQISYDSALKDYIEDFCNMVSFRICPRLPAIQRVKFTQWIMSDFMRLQGKDFTEGITSTHIVFWNHSALFSSQLKLLETCSDLLTTEDLVELDLSDTKPMSVKMVRNILESDNENPNGEESDLEQEDMDYERKDGSHHQDCLKDNDVENEEGIHNTSDGYDTDNQQGISFPIIDNANNDVGTSEVDCSFNIDKIPREPDQHSAPNAFDDGIDVAETETGIVLSTSGVDDSELEAKSEQNQSGATEDEFDIDQIITEDTKSLHDDLDDGKLLNEEEVNVNPGSLPQFISKDEEKTSDEVETDKPSYDSDGFGSQAISNVTDNTELKETKVGQIEPLHVFAEPHKELSEIGLIDDPCITAHDIMNEIEEPLEGSIGIESDVQEDTFITGTSDDVSVSNKQTNGRETLVQIVCMKMLPTRRTLEHYKNVKLWQIQVNSVLTLVGKVSPESQCIHYLRICSDIMSALSNGVGTSRLEHLASCIQEDDALDSEDVFEALLDMIEQPLPGLETAKQKILAEYLLRCLISDPESQAMSLLMNLVRASALPDKNVSVFKQVIKLALEYEVEEEDDIFFRILESGLIEDSNDYSGKDEDIPECERTFIKDLDALVKQLNESGMHECPFLILIIDIFEDVFGGHIGKSDDDDDSGTKFEMLVLSQKIIAEGTFNLQYIVAVGYFKACVKFSFENIHSANPKQIEYVNAVVGCKSDRNIQEYVWKVLSRERSASNLMVYLNGLKELLPNVDEIPCPDVYIENSFDRCPVFVFLKSKVEHKFEDTELSGEGPLNMTFEDIVKDAPTNTDQLLFLFGYAERMFYLPRSYSLLDDKTKSLADSVLKILNKGSLDKTCNHLLQCLLGKEDFRISNFMHSQVSPPLDCLLNTFFVSLYVLSTLHPCSLKSTPFFHKSLSRPVDLGSCFIPGNPDESDYVRPSHSEKVWYATCICQHRLVVFGSNPDQESCPVCHSLVKYWCKKEDGGDELESRPGFALDNAFKSPTDSVRQLSALSCQILSLITKGCLLGSLALGNGQPEQLEALLSISEIDISLLLWNEVEAHWHNIGTLLGVGEHTVGLYLHAVLMNTKETLFVSCPEMNTSEERNEWENDFEAIIQNVTQERCSKYQEMVQYHHDMCGVTNSRFEDTLLEMNEVDDNQLATCFRMKNVPSFENFICELFPVQEKYPILNLILTRERDLKLSRHIQSIMQWHIAVVSTANYTIKKHECLSLTVNDFIKQTGDEEKSGVLVKRFGKLQKSWSELIDLLRNCPFHGDMERIHANQKMENCIIHNQKCIQYKVLEFLVGTQNAFLDDALSVANRCESVQFLMRTEETAVFPCVHISDITSSHLLGSTDSAIEWHSLLDDNGHSRTCYGQGQMITYDFFGIESLLAERILVGRAFILLDSLPNVIFTDELYKNFVSLSQDIKKKVKQEALSSDMKTNIVEKQRNDTRISKELLMQIGMIMTLVNKTGGDPEKCLIDYVDEMKNTLTKKFSDDLLPSPAGAVKLCHIVAMYELLEELNADAIVEALEDQFRRELGMDLVNHFEELVKTNTRLSTFTLSACKRFINRCLSLREADESRPLLDYLSDDSFWPEDVKSGSTIRYGDSTVMVQDVLPKDVMVNHIYCLVTLISTEMENQRVERMEMTKMATSWKSTQRNKPVEKEKRKQNVAMKKRRNIRS